MKNKKLDLVIPANYGPHLYASYKEEIESWSRLNPLISCRDLLINWVIIISLISLYRFVLPKEYFVICFPVVVFLIAGRIGTLLNFTHEGVHGLFSYNKKTNHFIGKWFCSLPVGVNFEGYTSTHLRHHDYNGTHLNPLPDSEKFKNVSFRSCGLYLLFLKDLLGLSAIRVFFDYGGGGGNGGESGGKFLKKGHKIQNQTFSLKKFVELCAVQAILLVILFQLNLKDYVLLWIFPIISPHMFLMRIRGIGEHGLPKKLSLNQVETVHEGIFLTRSFLTPLNEYGFYPLKLLEKIFIGSINVNFHHEHHLFPRVPYYNLYKVNRLIGPQVKRMNSYAYCKGYLSAALKEFQQGI